MTESRKQILVYSVTTAISIMFRERRVIVEKLPLNGFLDLFFPGMRSALRVFLLFFRILGFSRTPPFDGDLKSQDAAHEAAELWLPAAVKRKTMTQF